MKLLLVDCTKRAQDFCARYRYNFDACDLGEAPAYLTVYDYDACVVDTVRPGDVAAIRRAAPRVGIVVIAKTILIQLIAAVLNAGADDVLRQPWHGDELDARVRAVVRRRAGQADPRVELVGDVAVDLSSETVTVAGQPLQLTQAEWHVLELLVLRRGRAVSKESIMERLYGGADGPAENKIVNVFICKLRRKLGGPIDRCIRTVWGRGYEIPT